MEFNENMLKVYLVTDNGKLRGRDFYTVVEESLKGGVTMVQLREKNISSKEFYEKAIRVRELTKKYNVPLIINDRFDIALSVGADGVHLGNSDIPVNVVRKICGDNFIIGATANTVDIAKTREKEGANYIGAGALFSTTTKNDTKPLTKERLIDIVRGVKIPVCAIGGINIDNVGIIKDTGISGVAVSSGIMGEENVFEMSKRFFDIEFKKSTD